MAETVSSYQVSTFTTPADGAQIVASVLKGNFNTLKSAFNNHDADGGVHLQSGTAASRPAFGTAGRKWLATDSGARFITYDTGSAWADLDYLKLTGGTLTGALTVSSGGIAITGNSTITGTLGSLTGLTVASGGATIAGAVAVTGAKTTLAATASGYASLNLPHGTAPSSPANGDVWTTTTGVFARVSGVSYTLDTVDTFANAGVVAYRQAGETVANGDDVHFTHEADDFGSMHDNVTNNERVTVPAGMSAAGAFVVTAQLDPSGTWAATGSWQLLLNGATVLATAFVTSGASTTADLAWNGRLSPSDYLTLRNNTGASQNITFAGVGTSPRLCVHRVA